MFTGVGWEAHMQHFEPDNTEAEVACGILAGRIVDFTDRPAKPGIRGALVRRLLLRQPICGVAAEPTVPLPGIRLRGCRIIGPLDLADFAQPGGGLSALVFEQCDFTKPLDLTGARIARLSLCG